jgi:DNA-binding response OmpR family regulator
VRNESVLIIEDDEGTAEIFESMLEARGFRVRVARDAMAGLLEIEVDEPAAILVDLHLPRMSGVEFLRRLRSDPDRLHLPAAVMTGDYLIDDQTMADIRALDARIVFKPIWEEDLVNLIDALIRRRRLVEAS